MNEPIDLDVFQAKMTLRASIAAASAEMREPKGFDSFGSDQTPYIPQEKLLPVQAFSEKLLPRSLRRWIGDAAYRLNDSPPDLIAAAAMCSLCALVGKRVGIYPKRNDDWLVVPNLWGAGVNKVSRNKTAHLSEGTRYLKALNTQAREAHNDMMLDYSVDIEVHTLSLAAAKKPTNGKLDADVVKATLRDLRDSTPVEPPRRRYIVTDTTVEKLSIIQSENPMGVLVLRDELTGWLRSIDREDHSEDRAYYLTGWNGTESWETDRISRAGVNVPSHVISVFGGIQPEKLVQYLRAMVAGGGNDGLMQRLQLLVYPDSPKQTPIDAAPDEEARALATKVFTNLDAIPCHDGHETIGIKFEDGAYEDFWRWYGELLARADREKSSFVAAHLSKYASLCPSLALVIELAEAASSGVPDIQSLSVSDTSVAMAVAWCTYLETHARRIYGLVDDPLAVTRILFNHLPDLVSPFTAREVKRKGWTGLEDKHDTQVAIDKLIAFNCIAREEIPARPEGGRPTVKYHINPKVLAILRGDEE